MKQRVEDHDTSRKYWTGIPNIVLRLGLTPFELALYVHLKAVSGESGACWKSTATLAKETHMSTGMVSKAKLSLGLSRPELNGKSLIAVEEQTGKAGKAFHLITLNDIWPENVVMQSSQSEVQTSRIAPQTSPPELQTSSGEVQTSHSETNKNPLRKSHEENPMNNNTPTGEAGEVFVYWREVHGHPNARLDTKRRKAIEAQLTQYSTEELKPAIEGCKLSPFNQGQNDRNTIYDDIGLICRDAAHVDRFIAFAEGRANGNGSYGKDQQRIVGQAAPQPGKYDHLGK